MSWTTAWNRGASFVAVKTFFHLHGRRRGTAVFHSLRWLIGFSVSNTLRRNTTGSSHNTYKRTHRTELVTVLVNCDTSSSHPSRSRMGYHGSCWSIVYRVVTVSTMRQQKNWGCVCVSGEGIYCNVVRKQREVMFFSVYWKKYTHMYIHNHNLVMSLAILTTPLFFQLSRRTLAAIH